MNQAIVNLFRQFRREITLAVAISVISLSLYGAFLLRFDFLTQQVDFQSFLFVLLFDLPIKLAVFWYFGVLRSGWRYASLSDLVGIGQAVVVSFLLLTLVLFLAIRLEGVPRSVLVIDSFLTFLAFSFMRLVTRLVREQYVPGLRDRFQSGAVTLIVGAGDSGQSIVREARKNPELPYQFIGFVDDDHLRAGLKFQGLPVLGLVDQVSDLCEEHDVSEIIIATPSATSVQMKRIVDLVAAPGRNVKTLPALADLINGKVSMQQVREVKIEDLLGRFPVERSTGSLREYLADETVLVSGAAGSIGSEICRQVIRQKPGCLILLDIAESPLFFLERELSVLIGPGATDLVTEIGDVRNQAGVETVFRRYRPSVIFHAAAYKHVPMMEGRPYQAVQTNILGTKNMADCAQAHSSKRFVMVSTDKAVNPVNVMGASKRCAELYVQTLQNEQPSRVTRFLTVRFGNVLDSAGSVIPIFKKQIAEGGPVTVTHPDIIRYFMTIPEATLLVLEAGGIGQGGEIFHLDMGAPVKIVELAEQLIRLSGFVPNEDINIEFSGLRSGEKLFEELLIEGEGVIETEHPSIRVLSSASNDSLRTQKLLDELVVLGPEVAAEVLVQRMSEVVPEYVHSA
jgi:FlaA1/EpsC-like NDP-sugar epimerase